MASPGLSSSHAAHGPQTLLFSWPSLDCVPFSFVLFQTVRRLQENAPWKGDGDQAQVRSGLPGTREGQCGERLACGQSWCSLPCSVSSVMAAA